jgi:cysteine desulfurase family protein
MSDEISREKHGQVQGFLYLDNAATSFPKAPGVVEAVAEHLATIAGSAGRGTHTFAAAADQLLWEARRGLNALFGTREATRWVFTLNATDALNAALKGYLKPGDHVIASPLEHNAVARCLRHLEKTAGLDVTRMPYVPGTGIDPNDVARLVRHDTRLVVAVHASNVTGEILPVQELARAAHEHDLPVLIDLSQTAGAMEVPVAEWGLDMVAITGHKGMLGPQGVGALYVRDGIELEPLRHGGTGTKSERDQQPTEWPNAMESGTMNGPGIAGLLAAMKWLTSMTVAQVRRHEVALMGQLLEGLANIPGVEIYGPRQAEQRAGLVSINIADEDPAWVAGKLEERGILTRSGLHCAPWAHQCIGTLRRGTLRLSLGPFLTPNDVERTTDALAAIASGAIAGTAM